MKIILIDLTYPRARSKAENLYEMAAKKMIRNKIEAWSLYGPQGRTLSRTFSQMKP
jgi:hypothetical protein